MNTTTLSNSWPKSLPVLSEEQERIRKDFMNHWLEVLPNRYGLIEKFNHQYPLRTLAAGVRTLEIGAGLGAHLRFENLEIQREYVALELQPELAKIIDASYPAVRVAVADCQEQIDFSDGHFDRILAIHVLEHLPNLPKALNQMQRLLSPTGFFSVVIPCEGGLAYRMARNISARRIFEKRYKQSYDWFVACEHINLPDEILSELRSRFSIIHQAYWPLGIPIVNFNLAIGLTLTHLTPPKATSCK
ncbi:Methyltransferase 24 [Candidatus Methylomirabilis oxygeniifera]|uniref:Methyltransferase 24 n=1 Tax=Methylomirabilis oxygeniifera TaxID=671143 RepID=D5MMA6_METO1|nr:Methyltransferase 24 [Candidatus Methylomirabilis oxyfera]